MELPVCDIVSVFAVVGMINEIDALVQFLDVAVIWAFEAAAGFVVLCVFSVVALFDALLVQFWQLVRLVQFVKFREFDFFFSCCLLRRPY